MAMTEQTRVNKTWLVIISAYIAALFIWSMSKGFVYFVDSNNYVSGVFYAPVLSELRYFYPYSAAVLALANIVLVLQMIRSSGVNAFSIT